MTFQRTEVPDLLGVELQETPDGQWINAEWFGRTLVVVSTWSIGWRVAAIADLKLVHEQLFAEDQQDKAFIAFGDVCNAAKLDALPSTTNPRA